MVKENPSYRERLAAATKRVEEQEDVQFEEVKTLFTELRSENAENLSGLRGEIEAFESALEKSNMADEVKEKLIGMIESARSQLATLRAQVEDNKPTPPKKPQGTMSKIFGGIGSKFTALTTSIAFSLGGFLKQAKEGGFFDLADQNKDGGLFNWAKLLKPLMAIVGMNRVEVASALQEHGFEGIDSKVGSFSRVMLAYKTRFAPKKISVEQFANALAAETKKQFPTKSVVSYQDLEDVAETLAVPEAPAAPAPEPTTTPQPNPEQASAAPGRTAGRFMETAVVTGGHSVLLSESGRFSVDKRKWQLKRDGIDFKINKAEVEPNRNTVIEVRYDNEIYTATLDPTKWGLLIANMAKETTIGEQLSFTGKDGDLVFDVVSEG